MVSRQLDGIKPRVIWAKSVTVSDHHPVAGTIDKGNGEGRILRGVFEGKRTLNDVKQEYETTTSEFVVRFEVCSSGEDLALTYNHCTTNLCKLWLK